MIDETESNVNLESNKFYEQNRFKNFDFTSYMWYSDKHYETH